MDLNKRWTLVEAFFRERGFVSQHLDSFNSFIERGVQRIIDEVKEIDPTDYKYKIPKSLKEEKLILKFGKVSFGKDNKAVPESVEVQGTKIAPTPMEARIRDLTYATPMFCEATPYIEGEPQETKVVQIGYMPIMVRSCICPTSKLSKDMLVEIGEDPEDPGGYFIINGSERVLVTIEDLTPNKIFVEVNKRHSTVVDTVKVFSRRMGFRSLVVVERRKGDLFYVKFPSLPTNILAVIVMRALGLESDKEIMEAVSTDPEKMRIVLENIEENEEIQTTEDALDYIGKKVVTRQAKEFRIDRAKQILDNYLLPHIGVDPEDRIRKAYFLGRMIRTGIEFYMGERGEDDKDHYSNKRLRLAGDLMEDLFRVAFRNLVKDIKYQMIRGARYVRLRRQKVQTAGLLKILH